MNNLNPTRIVDKNGKQTTVHKRVDRASTVSSALSAAKPTLGGKTVPAKGKAITKVKASSVARLHEFSLIKANPHYFEVNLIEDGEEDYGWRKVDTEMPTSRIYDYMRQGIDLTDATILDGLELSPDSLAEDFSESIPGRLGRINKKRQTVILRNGKVIDAMEEAGIPVAKAYKALENGLQDGHMDNLSIEQLVPLFAKWRYYGLEGTIPTENSSRLLDAVTSGRIPLELTESTSRKELSRLEGEIYSLETREPLLDLLNRDRALFIRVAEKAVKTMEPSLLGSHYDKPVSKMLNLIEEYGNDALDLRYPDLLNRPKKVNGEYVLLTMDDAKYIDAVEKIAIDRGDNYGTTWDRPFDDMRMNVQRDVKLDHSDLAELRSVGMSVETAHEMLVIRKMSIGQALTAHRDNVPTSISEGAL